MYYLLGGSGVPNYGDELIAKGWLSYLQEHFPEERVVLECALPSVSTMMLQPVNWRASHVSIVKSLAGEASQMKLSFWEQVERGYKFFARGGFNRHPRIKYAEQFLAEAKVYHMIGGGYISSKWPYTGFLLGLAGALKGTFGTRVVGTGLGLLPLSPPPDEHRKLFYRVINSFDFLECRDAAAAGLVGGLTGSTGKVRTGLDDCFLNPIAPADEHPPTLHISCFSDAAKSGRMADTLLTRHDEIRERFKRILFWECAPHRDLPARSEFQSRFPDLEVAGVQELIDSTHVGRNDFIVAARFHPHLMAARAGASGYYHSIGGTYYDNKHASVTALGSSFKPFSEFEQHGFAVESDGRMAAADAARVQSKRDIADSIYIR